MRAVLLVVALAGAALLGSKKVLGRVPVLGLRLLSRTATRSWGVYFPTMPGCTGRARLPLLIGL